MTREEKRETLKTFKNLPPIVRKAIAAGKVFSDLERETQQSDEQTEESAS